LISVPLSFFDVFFGRAIYTVQDNILWCSSLWWQNSVFILPYYRPVIDFLHALSVFRQGMLAIPDEYTLFRHGAVFCMKSVSCSDAGGSVVYTELFVITGEFPMWRKER
jgi:hypothetical protein